MRLIHSADWHLGQSFYGYSRQLEHEAFFSWLIDQIITQDVDALLISGDIFDQQNPKPDAVAQYYRFIHRLKQEGSNCSVYITAGNHDSPARLDAPRDLLHAFDTFVVGSIPASRSHIDLDAFLDRCLFPLKTKANREPEAYLLALPYIGFGRLFPAAEFSMRAAALIADLARAARERIGALPLVGMAHFYAGKSILSLEDEHERIIGNSEMIPTEAFADDFAYLALGHIHRRQQVGSPHIRYAGSPLAMSFSEYGLLHGVNLVELKNDGSVDVQELTFDKATQLIRLPQKGTASKKELELAIEGLPQLVEEDESSIPFVELNIKASDSTPAVADSLRQLVSALGYRLSRIMARRDVSRQAQDDAASLSKNSASAEMVSLTLPPPLQLAERYYLGKYGEEMPKDIQDALTEVIAEVMNREE